MFKNLFANLQKVGKALMLPVSVLPVAGILLGVGAANLSFIAGKRVIPPAKKVERPEASFAASLVFDADLKLKFFIV